MTRAGFVEGIFVSIAADHETLSAMLRWMDGAAIYTVPGTGGWTDGAHQTWGGFLRRGDAQALFAWLTRHGVAIDAADPRAVCRSAVAVVALAGEEAARG